MGRLHVPEDAKKIDEPKERKKPLMRDGRRGADGGLQWETECERDQGVAAIVEAATRTRAHSECNYSAGPKRAAKQRGGGAHTKAERGRQRVRETEKQRDSVRSNNNKTLANAPAFPPAARVRAPAAAGCVTRRGTTPRSSAPGSRGWWPG
jgi:hypothetical protein